MSLTNSRLKKVYHSIPFPHKLLFVGLAIAIILGIAFNVINSLVTHYSGNAFVSLRFVAISPIMLGLYAITLTPASTHLRVTLITQTYTLYYLMLVSLGLLVYGVQFTPFTPIDQTLRAIDASLNFNQNYWLDWTYHFPFMAKWLNVIYGLLSWEMQFIPLILAFFLETQALSSLFLSFTYSFILGTTLYYFFPTTAPASVFFNKHFASIQHDTFLKFFQIHHHLAVTTQEGGLIAFPSFHVIWCVLLTYSLRNIRPLFYPLFLINMFMIASTVLLGWHYLIDVIAAILLAVFSLAFAHRVLPPSLSLTKLAHRRGRAWIS